MNDIINKLSEKKGHTLVTVLLIMSVSVILATALISVALASYDNSATYYKQKQAYFTARSALDAFIGAVDASELGAMAALNEGTKGTFTVPMNTYIVDGVESSYQLTFKRAGKKYVKVTSYGAYKGESTRVSAYFLVKPNSICPTECLFYCMASSFKAYSDYDPTDPSNFLGRIVGRGVLNLDFPFTQTGDMIAQGSFNSTPAGVADIAGKLIVLGAASINAGSIDKLYTYGAFSGGATVGEKHENMPLTELGNDFAMQNKHRAWNASLVADPMGGSLLLANGDMYMPNDAWCFKEDPATVPFGFSPVMVQKYLGRFTIGGLEDFDVTRPDGRSWSLHGGILTDGDYTYDFANETVSLPAESGTVTIKYQTDAFGGGFYVSVNGGAYEAIDSDTVVTVNGAVYQKGDADVTGPTLPTTADQRSYKLTGSTVTIASPVTFDTTGGDIRVYCEADTLNINADIEVSGDHQVYFYLADGSEVYVNNNSKIGESATGAYDDVTQFNMIGNANQFFLLDQATYKGILYLYGDPAGAAVASLYGERMPSDTTGGLLTTAGAYKFRGSITADAIQFNGGNDYMYIPPIEKIEFDATLPMNYFIPPKSSAGSFEFERYGR